MCVRVEALQLLGCASEVRVSKLSIRYVVTLELSIVVQHRRASMSFHVV